LQLSYQAQLAALDDQFQAKLLAEIHRYEGLVREKDALNTQWDEQTKHIIESHDRALEELMQEFALKQQVQYVFYTVSLSIGNFIWWTMTMSLSLL
jgi:CHAD domain-containing protein